MKRPRSRCGRDHNRLTQQRQDIRLDLLALEIDTRDFSVELPDRGLDADNVNIKLGGFNPQAMEVTVKRVRLPLVHRFVRANGLDRERIRGSGGLGRVRRIDCRPGPGFRRQLVRYAGFAMGERYQLPGEHEKPPQPPVARLAGARLPAV